MKVEISHHVDASEKDVNGDYEWHYEYDLYCFSNDQRAYVARSYSDDCSEAHFLRKENVPKAQESGSMLSRDDLVDPLFLAAVGYLRTNGKTDVQWLGKGDAAYQAVSV